MMPFGVGTRSCPGRYQTQMILRAIVAAVVLNFDVSTDPTQTNEGTMEPIDTFVGGRSCPLYSDTLGTFSALMVNYTGDSACSDGMQANVRASCVGVNLRSLGFNVSASPSGSLTTCNL